MENYCKNCGAHIKDNARFCQECGKEVENVQLQCPNCGENIDENTVFCPECGKDISAKLCPKCGESIEDAENFCENCGFELSKPQTKNNFKEFVNRYKIPLIIIATIVIIAVIILTTLSFIPENRDVRTQIVTVGTNRFEIPGDYRISPDSIDVDYTGFNVVFSQGYTNNQYEYIHISVMNIPPNADGQEAIESQGGIQKTLMGVNGYFNEEDTSVYTFAFVDGAYLNIVTVSSPYIFDEITYLG